MWDFLSRLFDTSDFPPRWNCGSWSSGHGWLHILSDLGVWAAYLAIPFVLGYFVLRKKDVPFRTIFWLFGAFILACGTTHLMEALIFWWPAYRLAGLIKLFTALISWATVIALVPIIPQALSMRSPIELEEEISRRKQAEAKLLDIQATLEKQVRERTLALQESEERYRLFVELNPDAVLVSDGAKVVLANRAAAVLLGKQTTQELLGCSHLDFVHPDSQSAVRDHWLNLVPGGEPAPRTEQKWLRKDGSVVEVDAMAYRVPHREKSLLTMVASDATQRKQTQKRFRLVVEAAPNGLVMIDQAGRVVLANPQMEKLFGYSQNEMLDQPVETLVPEQYRPLHSVQRTGYLKDPEARAMGSGRDLFGQRKDGSKFPVEIGLTPMATENGIFVLASVIDITERKRAEELMQASLREKEVLLREIHHRVKNNLQIISALLQLQSDRCSDKAIMEMFRESQQRVRSMALIHERLYRSQNLAQVDFGEYARSLADSLRRSYAANHVTIEVTTNRMELPIDMAVPCALLVNELVSNCLKYAFPGGRSGTVRIELHHDQGNNGSILLAVSDDGVGLPPELDVAQAETFGLRLVAALVDQLHGSIEIRNSKGTTFQVRFPAAHDAHVIAGVGNNESGTHPGRGR